MADYELITYNGHNEQYRGKKVRRYKDGSIRNERGHLIEKLDNNGHDITAENSREYARLRWEKYQQAAAEAVAQEIGSIHPGANTPFAAWGVLNAKTASAIMDSDKPRGRDLEYVGRNIGAVPTAFDGPAGENGSVTIPGGAVNRLLDILSGAVREDADVIDAE